MAATANEIALQLVQQLRILDPSLSAEIGTPERKLLDTFAQALSANSIDFETLQGALDLSGKTGSELDAYLSIFRFGRLSGSPATGFATFSRTTASSFAVPIPSGSFVVALNVAAQGVDSSITYRTTSAGQIAPGETSVIVPIRAVQVGTIGNVGVGDISAFGQSPIVGVTSVTNEIPTRGGEDPETDEEFKIRFQNTVFRNLSGTADQYLALAVATQFSTKANVVGPISRYREYIQVPDVDDASADPDSGVNGNGSAGRWTSALSTVPYAKHTYSELPYFLTDGGTIPTYYRRDLDYVLNTSNASRDRGDTYRNKVGGTGYDVYSDSEADFQPNMTFLNVVATDADATIQALRPGQIVLLEHSYMSSASRNDYAANFLNCVDVYVNGRNEQLADAVIARPTGTFLFSGSDSDPFYTENFRRVGEAGRRPVAGNVFSPMFWSPVANLPDQIVTSDATYVKGIHYWPVQEVSDIGRTVRSRDGIEWNPNMPGKVNPNPEEGPFTGPKITASADSAIKVTNYTYDRNIVDLQAALEANKQVTTDVLAHQSQLRYFKLDITVMYTYGSNPATVNAALSDLLDDFYSNQYFGSVIQLSDLLQVIHIHSSVDNVRWSKEVLTGAADSSGNPRNRIIECDIDGNPLLRPIIDRKTPGTASSAETQQMYLYGAPESGSYKLKFGAGTTAAIDYDADATAINSALSSASIPASITSGTGTSLDPWIITFGSNGFRTEIISVADNDLDGGFTVFNADFFLRDSELPAVPTTALSTDTAPGLIVRTRAQGTWNAL